MKKKSILLLTALGVISSCLTSKTTTNPAAEKAVVINYDYAPPTKSTDKVDISFILLNPTYAKTFEGERQPMFTKFINNMGADFEEMLVAKGYSIRGPYDTYDEIVYADKNETDLLLESSIDFTYEWSSEALKKYRYRGGNYTAPFTRLQINGDLHLGGKVNLVIKEAITQEKLWVKSIPLIDKAIPVLTSTYKGGTTKEALAMVLQDVGYKNAVYKALDDYYQKALKTAWNHLEPKELEALKKQVRDLRKKKGY
jgi:hypothetical protein